MGRVNSLRPKLGERIEPDSGIVATMLVLYPWRAIVAVRLTRRIEQHPAHMARGKQSDRWNWDTLRS
jgi:hypothetical protein